MGTADNVHRRFRVGLVVLVALVAFGFGIFMVGRRADIFTRKLDYHIHFSSASGLIQGNAVRLAGVNVGTVTEVSLSGTPGDSSVNVTISVDRRMSSRLRTDTKASIKTIGLLGDKYIELTGGTSQAAEIAPGGEVPAAQQTGIEKLLAGGEGMLGDLTAIARSLKIILGRTEKGEGLLGELTRKSEKGDQLGSSLTQTLNQLSVTLDRINSGKSLAGKLLVDEKYGKETGDSLSAALSSASQVFGKLSSSLDDRNGAVSALLNDPEGKRKVYRLLDNLSQAGVSLAKASADLEQGKGALPMLLHDEQFGQEFRQSLANFTRHLDSISAKLDQGDGSLSKLINDPSLYDAANDVVVGVNDSKLLRWLIRNRQKRGIQHRYDEEKARPAEPPSRNP